MIKYKNITKSKISNSASMLSTKQQIVYDIYSNGELVSITEEFIDSFRKTSLLTGKRKNQLVPVCAEWLSIF